MRFLIDITVQDLEEPKCDRDFLVSCLHNVLLNGAETLNLDVSFVILVEDLATPMLQLIDRTRADWPDARSSES